MEAKDTVIPVCPDTEILTCPYCWHTVSVKSRVKAEREHQADISFKAGIREVVDWIESKGCQERDEGSGDWYWEFDFILREHDWRTKLKEWGIA